MSKTTREQRESLRHEWETNPAATLLGLGSTIGLSSAGLRSHATLRGWTRTPEVIAAAKAHAAERSAENIRGRYTAWVRAGRPPKSERPKKGKTMRFRDARQGDKPVRFASVWEYARHG